MAISRCMYFVGPRWPTTRTAYQSVCVLNFRLPACHLHRHSHSKSSSSTIAYLPRVRVIVFINGIDRYSWECSLDGSPLYEEDEAHFRAKPRTRIDSQYF